MDPSADRPSGEARWEPNSNEDDGGIVVGITPPPLDNVVLELFDVGEKKALCTPPPTTVVVVAEC